MVNRALELIGKELGMFRDDQPRKPLTLDDLSDADIQKLLDDAVAPGTPMQ